MNTIKTLGGYNVTNFKKLEEPIERGILKEHIYIGTIENAPIVLGVTHTTYDDFEDITWDEDGKCNNLNREDCFLDLDTLKPLNIKTEESNKKDYVEYEVSFNYHADETKENFDKLESLDFIKYNINDLVSYYSFKVYDIKKLNEYIMSIYDKFNHDIRIVITMDDPQLHIEFIED